MIYQVVKPDELSCSFVFPPVGLSVHPYAFGVADMQEHTYKRAHFDKGSEEGMHLTSNFHS